MTYDDSGRKIKSGEYTESEKSDLMYYPLVICFDLLWNRCIYYLVGRCSG